MNSFIRNKIAVFFYSLMILSFSFNSVAVGAFATTENNYSLPKLSFTFDDGLSSTLLTAAPTLQKYTFSATNYITTNCINSVNTCRADENTKYMTWDQVRQLQDNYGWEIGSHTVNHYPLTELTYTDKEYELSKSREVLSANGFNAKSFSSPYGDYDPETISLVAKYYESHRGFWDQGTNVWPYNEYLINVVQVQVGVSIEDVKTQIDQAILNKEWVVLVFHDILNKPQSSTYSYHYYQDDLDEIAAYAKLKQDAGQLSVTRVGDVSTTNDSNLLVNNTFDNGINSGWHTDSPEYIKPDSLNNGNYPGTINSIKLTAGSSNSHLFSPQVPVESVNSYVVKSFLNIKQLAAGEVGFYIDEYNSNGNWISGQWKTALYGVSAQNVAFDYTPSSSNVSMASLQIYTTGNSGIIAHVDNVRFFTQTPDQTPPTPEPVPEPTPEPTPEPVPPINLIINGTFDSGITRGWTTDSATQISHDSSNNGSPSNPQHSIKYTGTTRSIHLFSPKINVTNTKTYNITSYLRINQVSNGEVGFYIDEYNANGNWISGQWKTARYSVSSGDVAFTYTPTSTSVSSASLQVYATGNSGVIAFVDNIRWIAQD